MRLLLRDIHLPLAGFTLEVNVELRAPVTAIYGPSGSGKTSLLELVAGLRRAKAAFVQLEDEVLTDTRAGVFVPVRKRGLGCVPQDLALFPHLSVRQNLNYGVRQNGGSEFNFGRIVELLEIQSLIARAVTELSGGERQRVALARALLASPRLLLLDEPLASLDQALKLKILPYLARIRDEIRIPMLYVTHDRFETLSLADEMLVLVRGQVAQFGPVREVFNRPANLAVAGIVSVETVQPGKIVARSGDLVTVAVGETATLLAAVDPGFSPRSPEVYACIRAEDVMLLKGADTPGSARNHLKGTIQAVVPEGPLMRVELDCGFRLSALLTRQACEEMALKYGDAVVALVKAPTVHLIPR